MDTLTVTNAATLSGGAAVTGTLVAGTTTLDTLTVTNAATLSGGAAVTGTLASTGNFKVRLSNARPAALRNGIICCEKFSEVPQLGRFTLRDEVRGLRGVEG